MGFLGLQPVGRTEVLVLWLIMVGTSIIVIFANILIEKYFFNEMKKNLEGKLQLDEELKSEDRYE